MKKLLVIWFLTFLSAQITGLAEHYEMVPFSSSDSLQRQDRFRINIIAQKGIYSFNYSGELVQESISDPALFWDNREAYIELAFPLIDIRTGKQKVEWGLINGWFLSDRINPRDMRYHLTRSLNDIRVGIIMVRTRMHLFGFSLEGIWNPKIEYDPIIDHGPWRERDGDWINDPHSLFILKDKYDKNLKNEFGLRLAGSVGRLQYRLMWFDGYQDELWVEYSNINWLINPDPIGDGEIQPYKMTNRQTFYGFDCEYPLGYFSLQAEFGYETPFWYNTFPSFVDTGSELQYKYDINKSNRSLSMIGIKYSGLLGLHLNGQWINKQILDYTISDKFPATEQYGIFSASGSIPGLNAGIDYWTLSDLKREGGLSKIELYYLYTQRIIVTMGIHTVWGNEDHWIGQFYANDYYFIKGTFIY